MLRFIKNESGASSFEYVLIFTIVSISVIAGASFIGVNMKDMYSGITYKIEEAIDS